MENPQAIGDRDADAPPAPGGEVERPTCDHFEDVYWNPYNRVVQCHHCGKVYVPVTAPPGEPYRRAWESVYGESPLPRDVRPAVP